MARFSDVNKLRKEGRLREAYLSAREMLTEDPDNVWAKRAMMWVVYDYAKKNSSPNKRTDFLRCLKQIAPLAIEEDEDIYYNAMMLLTRNVVRKCVGDPNSTLFLTELFSIIQQWSVPKPSSIYSGILQTFLKVKDQWPSFADFCEWWDFDNLRSADFEANLLPDGKRDFPLAEKAYMAYSKSLLLHGSNNKIRDWLPQLMRIVEECPSYQFLPYYFVKLSLKIGDTPQALKLLKPLMLKKSNEFWIWELLADVENDPQEKLIILSKAMNCHSSEKMTIVLREKVAVFLLENGFVSESKHEFEEVVRIRDANRWRVSDDVKRYLGAKVFEGVSSSRDNELFFKKHAREAERKYLGMELIEAIVVHVNEAKGYISFTTNDRRRSFFRVRNKKKLQKVSVGDRIELQVVVWGKEGPSKISAWHTIG